MKLLKTLALLLLIVGLYFGYIRDHHIHYPIQVSLENTKGEKLAVQMVGRSDQIIQFTKDNSNWIHEYPVRDINMISKAKLAFLPKRRTAAISAPIITENPQTPNSAMPISAMHMTAMREEMEKHQTQLRLLRIELGTKATKVERGHIQLEINTMKTSIAELELKMETFQAHVL